MKTPNTRKAISLALLISMFVSTPIHCFSGKDIVSAPRKGCALLYNAFLRVIGKGPKEPTKIEKAKRLIKKGGRGAFNGGKKVVTGCGKAIKGCAKGCKNVAKAVGSKIPKNKYAAIIATVLGVAGVGALIYWLKNRGSKPGPDAPTGLVEEEEEEEEVVEKKGKLLRLLNPCNWEYPCNWKCWKSLKSKTKELKKKKKHSDSDTDNSDFDTSDNSKLTDIKSGEEEIAPIDELV